MNGQAVIPGNGMLAAAWLLHILPEQRPPQIPRERHLRLGPQRGELTGHALPLRGGFPGDPPGGGEEDAASVRALATLRDKVIPNTLGKVPGVRVAGGAGETAGTADLNALMGQRAPWVFAFLLMLLSFRSLTIAITSICSTCCRWAPRTASSSPSSSTAGARRWWARRAWARSSPGCRCSCS